MTIDNLKQLEKLMKLCRKNGVSTIHVDGIDLVLAPQDDRAKTIQAMPELHDPMQDMRVPEPNIQDPIAAAKAEAARKLKELQDYIHTDAPTEEQIMFYSSRPETPPEQ